MAGSTPIYESLMDKARAALVELDQALVEAEQAEADAAAAVRELLEQRRRIAAVLGEKPTRKPKALSPAPAEMAAAVGYQCSCGRVFEKPHNLGRHRAAAGCPASAMPRLVEAAPDPGPDPAQEAAAGTGSMFERDVLAMWERNPRDPAYQRVKAIADATGKRPSVVREVLRAHGIAA